MGSYPAQKEQAKSVTYFCRKSVTNLRRCLIQLLLRLVFLCVNCVAHDERTTLDCDGIGQRAACISDHDLALG
jgi:hypothetical protein